MKDLSYHILFMCKLHGVVKKYEKKYDSKLWMPFDLMFITQPNHPQRNMCIILNYCGSPWHIFILIYF